MKRIPGFSILLCSFLLVLFCAGCEKSSEKPAAEPLAAPAQPAASYDGTIVAMGDSLTEGLGVDESEAWPALLEEQLQENGYIFRVVNAGVSGETSSGALSRVEWTLTLDPDIVILETGANDGLRGIDPEVTRQNLFEIIEILQENKIVVILAGMEMVRNMGDDYTGAFAEIYPEVARETGVILIPFFLKGVASDPQYNQSDGIHPNAEGHRLIARTVYPYVIQAIKAWPGTVSD